MIQRTSTCWKRYTACLALAAGMALSSLLARGGASPTYAALKPDEFIKNWLILKPIPVQAQESAPSEEMQTKAFAQDWLLSQGGEAKIQPRPGLKQKVGDRE